MKLLIFISIILLFYSAKSQGASNDSGRIVELKKLIKETKNDTNKINAYVEWDNIIYMSNPELDLTLNKKIITLCDKKLKGKLNTAEIIYYEKQWSIANINIGLIYTIHGDYTLSLNYFSSTLSRIQNWEKLKIIPSSIRKKQKATALSGLGVLYKEQGNYLKALDNYYKSLKLDEELKNNAGITKTLGHIGGIHRLQNDNENALKYYFRSLKIAEQIHDKKALQATLGNIGNVYTNKLDYNNAMNYYLKAIALATEIGDQKGIAIWLGNLGSLCQAKDSLNAALNYFLRAIELAAPINFKPAIGSWQGNIGEIYLKLNKVSEAKIAFLKGYEIAVEINDLNALQEAEYYLSSLYEKTGENKQAYTHYKLYITYRDSIANDENTKKQTQLEMQYDFDKQHAADSIKNVAKAKEETLKHNQEIKQQKIYTYGGIIGFSLMLVVAVVSFRAFRNKQKVNFIIAEQKLLVEEKQKEILDSIHYAKRIQQALLPSEKYIYRIIHKFHNN